MCVNVLFPSKVTLWYWIIFLNYIPSFTNINKVLTKPGVGKKTKQLEFSSTADGGTKWYRAFRFALLSVGDKESAVQHLHYSTGGASESLYRAGFLAADNGIHSACPVCIYLGGLLQPPDEKMLRLSFCHFLPGSGNCSPICKYGSFKT